MLTALSVKHVRPLNYIRMWQVFCSVCANQFSFDTDVFIYSVSNGENDVPKEADFSYMQSQVPTVSNPFLRV